MEKYSAKQAIGQLEKRKGGYFYLTISAEIVEQFDRKKKTRLICRLDDQLEFQCGLNHLGDGNFFIIISMKNLKSIDKQVGEEVQFEIWPDPNPLGVDIPEEIVVLLGQDEILNQQFENLTDGKKRGIIHQVKRIKNIDLKITRAIELISGVRSH